MIRRRFVALLFGPLLAFSIARAEPPQANVPPASVDADLIARMALASTEGVRFIVDGRASGTISSACTAKDAPCAGAALAFDINWKSAPGEVVLLDGSMAATQNAQRLLADKDGRPLISISGHDVIVSFEPTAVWRNWPYFNYLLAASAAHAAGTPMPRFADWEHAPMPGSRTRKFALGLLTVLWATAFAIYRSRRRRGKERPSAAADFFRAVAGSSPDKASAPTWNRPGFVRPLAGLLTLLGAMFPLVGVYLALQWLLGRHVQPFPQADGLWRTPYDMLWVVWLLFDLGTQTAFVKYFAEHRTHAPDKALADVQFYIWWQIFARLTQASALCAIALGYLPYSQYALYAPFVGIYALLHVPAISGIGKLMCQALQRFDVQNLLDMAEMRLLVFIVPMPFVLAGRHFGATHPVYGEAFGAALGLGVGQLASHLVSLGLGLFALRKLEIPVEPLFLAQFDRTTAFRQLKFGAKLTLGQEPFKLVQFLESLIIIHSLADFTMWQGVRDLLSNRLQLLFFFAWMFYQSAMPAISEALSAGKRVLTQYYVARYFQFGALFGATVFSLLMAVGPLFLQVLGPQWAAATPYLPLALASGLLLPWAWISDALEQGAGRGWTFVVVITIEQSLRLGLMLYLVPRYQFAGLLLGALLALVAKAIVGWTINHKTIVPFKLSVWSTIVAPTLAGLGNFFLWKLALQVGAPTTVLGTLGLLWVASAASFFVCFFLCGLAGGFDRESVDELEQASAMTSPALWMLRPVSIALARVAAAGSRLAPAMVAARSLPIAAEAHAEADALAVREAQAVGP